MSVLAIVILLAVLALGCWLFLKRPHPPSRGSTDGAGPTTRSMGGADGAPARRWDEVLQVSPSATVAEIRAAHARLMRVLGPGRIAALAGDARQQAECDVVEINHAYRRGLQVRGGDG
jgi:hypothetical protein